MKKKYLTLSLLALSLFVTLPAFAQVTQLTSSGNPNVSYLKSTSIGLLFSASNTNEGFEPYISNGTVSGTFKIAEINTTNNGTNYSSLIGDPNFTEMNGLVYFGAGNSVNNIELWVTDGTNAGTNIVKEIAPSLNSSSNPYFLTTLNGRVLCLKRIF